MLKFQKGNAKLHKKIHTFSIPAGWSCPGAKECKSKVHLDGSTRTLKDGPDTLFRCFAASQEVLYPNVYKARRHNLDALRRAKTSPRMKELISSSLPKKAKFLRVHVSGDFYSQAYFDAWMQVARDNPSTTFYAYTKSLNFWVKRLGNIPTNFMLTASRGGRFDGLIKAHGLREAKVVFSEEEAKSLNLPIDKDDSYAMSPKGNFALLLHGVQPKGSEAASALSALRKAGKGGYKRLPLSK